MAWNEDDKSKAIQMYQDAEPTPETSTEIIKDIADELDQSANGVRMVLVQAGVYVKKDPGTAKAGGSTKAASEGSKRVSKDSQLDALRAAISARGAELDEDILAKLTGKAAAYFVTVLSSK